jgi:urease accessory protein
LITAATSIELHIALLGYLHAYVVGQVSAAVRLIPLGATEGQLTIRALQPDLLEIAEYAQDAKIEDLGSFTPGLDIRSMQHEQLYSRLFIS